MAELNTQSRDGWIAHKDGAAETAPTSLKSSGGIPSTAYDVTRARTVHMRIWTCDNGNDAWAGGGVADVYIIGWPHPKKDLATTGTTAQYTSAAQLLAAFEITGATSGDTALALIDSEHPITANTDDNSNFYECLDVDFGGVFSGGDVPQCLTIYSAAGEDVTSGALDGSAPLSFLIDVLGYQRIEVIPANFSGTGFDRIVIGLRKID